MIRKTITLGVAPVKRASRDMNFAKKQKDRFMAVIRAIRPDFVKIVDIDDLSENGIAFKNDVVPAIVDKFKAAKIDALFIPFCDFGEESVASAIAASFRLPTLVWGNRDTFPNTRAGRGRIRSAVCLPQRRSWPDAACATAIFITSLVNPIPLKMDI